MEKNDSYFIQEGTGKAKKLEEQEVKHLKGQYEEKKNILKKQ